MHCQSQISIIWNNGVERAHKSKNADKTHPDKLYKQGRHKRKKKEERKVSVLMPEEAPMQTGRPRTPHFSAASAETSSGCRAQTCSHCPPDPGWFSTAVCLLWSIWLTSQHSLQPPHPDIHVPGSICTPNHTWTSCLLSPFLDNAKQL